MPTLKERLHTKIQEWRPRTINLIKNHGDIVVDDVTIKQVIGGMRGVKSLISDISYLDPYEGIRYRGFILKDVITMLPKNPDDVMPYVEGLFYLLLTGDIPTNDDVLLVLDEFNKRKKVPGYVFDLIDAFPPGSHPMSMFSAAILSMSRESIFQKQYHEGIKKENFWEPTYEDALNLLAKLPEIAAYIYTKKYRNGKHIASDPILDYGANFARMMNIGKPYHDVSRMYFIIHSDHESGNVSAHTAHLVGSSLADIYLCNSSMINGLAGPLHGLANQEVILWIKKLIDRMDNKLATEQQVKDYVWETLNSGQVIPGFGHAVLRKTDPRYTLQREFSLKYLKDDLHFKYVDMLYRVVPPILTEQGKAKNPWPNVDAHSGIIQWHYNVKEYEFYTVLFGLGRAIGICANLIWDRALVSPIERPKSVTTKMLEDLAESKKAG